VARLPTGTSLALPVEVVHGVRPGPRIWLSGVLHGDEVVGVEIIRQVLERLEPEEMAGAVVAAPIVNVFGFVTGSRYTPDGRDVNRSFPGSRRGSLASRLARLFMDVVVAGCEYGIDFHAGSGGRTNLPQIRTNVDDPEALRCARAFGAPVTILARTRDSSLRQAAAERGAHVLLYEGGETLRFEPGVVRAGVDGTLRVLECLEMCEAGAREPPGTRVARKTHWLRAGRSGILLLGASLGREVRAREEVGRIVDSFGKVRSRVRARSAGIVIGQKLNPLVNRGDALLHVALSPEAPDESSETTEPSTHTERSP